MRRIGLLGATGYTGRLTAEELARRGIRARLGGRDRRRLDAVAGLDGAERVVVDTTRRSDLDRFLDGLDVLVTTVGPFTQLGAPVVAAAVAAGVAYVDSTGEPGFMRDVYRAYADAPVPVVPACGFDYVPGDCALAAVEDDLPGPPTHLRVTYAGSGVRPSRGTARTAVEAAVALAGETRPRGTTVWTPGGERRALSVPWGETVTVPHRRPGVPVEACLVAPPGLAARVGVGVAGRLGPLSGPLLRVSAPVLRRAVERLPEGPDAARRGATRVQVVAEARSGDAVRRAVVEVRDIYRFTAVALVEAALRVTGTGALTPAQALGGASMLDTLASGEAGGLLSWERLASER